ncbi:protein DETOXIFICATION 55-like [Bidens hawaiensis]|uniref:protein DETOXIFICATION 55-like n=1 Tax=Bidens hawaiensis TaxID=980011 RepID=UPI00404A87DD
MLVIDSQSPNGSPGRPISADMHAFSESVKSKFSAASARYKESISKGTQGLKAKLLAKNSSVKELSKGVQREMSAGMAGVARIFERLDPTLKRNNDGTNLNFFKGKNTQNNSAETPTDCHRGKKVDNSKVTYTEQICHSLNDYLDKVAVKRWKEICYELMTFLSGYLHKPYISLAASAIVIQTTSLMYTLPSALSMSISTRVGHELGAGEPGRARLATLVAIGLALLTSAFGLLGITYGREAWGKVFTSDSEVLELTMAALPIIGVCELANCPQTTCSGVLRGSARPSIGARINLCSFYLVGTPIAIILAFVWRLGFLGLCYGLLAAQVACVLSILIVIYRTDWEKESLNARQLVGRSSEYQIMECEQGIGFI